MRLTVFLTASIMGVTIAVKTDFAGLNEAGAMGRYAERVSGG